MTTMYGNFTHVHNPILRTWNILNTYLNIIERFGKEVGKNYLRQFKKRQLINIHSMMNKINNEGYENVRRTYIRTEFKQW